MTKMILALIFFVVALQASAQTVNPLHYKVAEQECCTEYKRVAGKILKDDELFVMFYMDAALVVDPNADTQIVKQVKTENPWVSLREYLNDKSNIYFCPSGSQLGVAIEYMPCPDDANVIMSDRYGMYRLSSPEELFKNRGEAFRNSKHKAVVFGGLDYDDMSDNVETLLAFRGKRSAEGYGELKNAYEEAIYIDSLLRRKGIEVALLNGEQGSERSFYELPSSKADILHIASHGEYKPNEDNLESHTLEEWMMSHSALILSGYNQYSEDKKNDGRLTAYEISQTDLSNIKLAVLSACETGKGDIKENDVYGLLKGFKMAGAGTLMLSLSNVNDEPTSILMKRFYENIFRGDNPRRALENAQMYLRIYLDTYKDGLYKDSLDWKKFILVDDLDRNIGQGVTEEEREYFLDDIIGLRDVYTATQLFPNWDKVREKLKDNDKVVRFFPYIVIERESKRVQCVALVGDVKSGVCRVRKLFSVTEDNLEHYRIKYDSHLEDEIWMEYDSIIWKPIANDLLNVHRVFFIAPGLLNNIPLECLESVVDKYELHRISSLEVLLNKPMRSSSRTRLALFGDLEYYCMDNEDDGYPPSPLTRAAINHLDRLWGTKLEIEQINKIANDANISSIMYTACNGTEGDFYALLENDNVDAIHIATHAYSGDPMIKDDIHSIQEYMLSQCALFFSGAGDIIDEEEPNFFNNNGEGILTGAEIARSDLKNLDFVTLSACNTNIGLTNNLYSIASENSWSLTNAFKIGGTKALLSSLWAVDDEATSYVMMNFYENWLWKKMTLHDALEAAKKSVRETKGWEDPKYWASFILLDGLD